MPTLTVFQLYCGD